MIKEIKQKVKRIFGRHYLVMLFICLFVLVFGMDFWRNLDAGMLRNRNNHVWNIFSDKLERSAEIAGTITRAAIEQSKKGAGSAVFGRSRGLFAVAVNSIVSGSAIHMFGKAVGDIASFSHTAMALMAAAVLFPLSDIRSLMSKISEKHLDYRRHYPVLSLIFIFFVFSAVGWIWEVSLHLVVEGKFVNRGILHGPWLPVYGAGSVLILAALNIFRKKPVAEFFSVIVLCGCVEYFTSCFLELFHGGRKWWDYSGYFLNLHGRICAEGLLAFGIGGMVLVYFLAPLLDDWLHRRSGKTVIWLCAVLLLLFAADAIYSVGHPNTGEGITGDKRAGVEYEMEEVFL